VHACRVATRRLLPSALRRCRPRPALLTPPAPPPTLTARLRRRLCRRRQYQDTAALQVCQRVLSRDPHSAAVTPVYAALLLERRDKAQLFFVANALAEDARGAALTLHVLGCYHLLIGRHEQAWRLFHNAAKQVRVRGEAAAPLGAACPSAAAASACMP
jgi:hypothetical protein